MSCDNCSSCNSFSCETEDVQEIQQFVPGKQYSVGELFKYMYDKRVYKVVRNRLCWLCDFHMTFACSSFPCTKDERNDNTEVQAILYDSEE